MVKIAANIVLLYTFFAVLSTIINIVSQMVSIWAYTGPFAIEVSILVGTATVMPLRYFLDKRHIFTFTSINIAHDGKLFLLYSAMSVITTFIFWGTEYVFHFIFDSDLMRYLGGIIGLAIGFFIKYQLDKKYVFVNSDNKVLF